MELTAYEPHLGHNVRVRRYEVTGSLEPEDGVLVADSTGCVAEVRRSYDGQIDVFRLSEEEDFTAPGYVFLGTPEGHGMYLITTVEPVVPHVPVTDGQPRCGSCNGALEFAGPGSGAVAAWCRDCSQGEEGSAQ